MGWEEFDIPSGEVKPAVRRYTLNDKELASVMNTLFSSPTGQLVLDGMRERYEERTTLPAQASDGHALAIMMAVREGENNLYRWIKSMIRKGTPNASINDSAR